jgi:hypothetical protein
LAFVDPADNLHAAQTLQARDDTEKDIRLLLESPVLYEAVRPFLQAIQNIDPVVLPLAEYIRHGDLKGKSIALPEYTTVPQFVWDLKSLLKEEHQGEECMLDPASKHSIAAARDFLHNHGKLDNRYVQSMSEVHIFRELSSVKRTPFSIPSPERSPSFKVRQGPERSVRGNTEARAHDQTFTGVELLRLLIENGIGSVFMQANRHS